MLAHGAVHGAFAGFTGITVGLVNTHYCYLPSKCQELADNRPLRLSACMLLLSASPLAQGGKLHWAFCGVPISYARVGSYQSTKFPVCPAPIPSTVPLIIQAPRRVDPNGELWNRLRSSCGQPNFSKA